MWIMVENNNAVYSVGYFRPLISSDPRVKLGDMFYEVYSNLSKEMAARMVNHLNGGTGVTAPVDVGKHS